MVAKIILQLLVIGGIHYSQVVGSLGEVGCVHTYGMKSALRVDLGEPRWSDTSEGVQTGILGSRRRHVRMDNRPDNEQGKQLRCEDTSIRPKPFLEMMFLLLKGHS
jgi:hypothetical protein